MWKRVFWEPERLSPPSNPLSLKPCTGRNCEGQGSEIFCLCSVLYLPAQVLLFRPILLPKIRLPFSTPPPAAQSMYSGCCRRNYRDKRSRHPGPGFSCIKQHGLRDPLRPCFPLRGSSVPGYLFEVLSAPCKTHKAACVSPLRRGHDLA